MTMKRGRILVVDDDRDVLLAARLFLKQHAETVRPEEAPRGSASRQERWIDPHHMISKKDAIERPAEGFWRKIREIDRSRWCSSPRTA